MTGITGLGRRRRNGRRMGLVAAVLAVAALLAAACGGGTHAGPSASPSQGRAQQLVAFAQCLRNNGEPNAYISNRNSNSDSSGTVLSIMGFTLTGVTPGSAQFVSAMKACKHLLPGGGPAPLTQQQKTRMLKFAACMRAHGYPAYPDPVFGSGGGVYDPPLPSSVDTTSPQYEAALKACNQSS